LLHEKVRKELWGYAKQEAFSNEELIKEKYSGIRPAMGFPSSPDHTEKDKLFDLLEATKRTGVELTENRAMMPAASVSGLYFANPKSKYFMLGEIQEDQKKLYCQHKNWTFDNFELWAE